MPTNTITAHSSLFGFSLGFRFRLLRALALRAWLGRRFHQAKQQLVALTLNSPFRKSVFLNFAHISICLKDEGRDNDNGPRHVLSGILCREFIACW